MRPINEIIIHATATHADWRAGEPTSDKVAEVRRWHVQDRGWSDIGYHYLIDRDGTIAKGRPVERTGAHVRGHNTGTIGVALFGGHGGAETDRFSDHFTPQQERSLVNLLRDLSETYNVSKISGHNQYAAKACPCFHVPSWWRSVGRAPRTSKAESTTLQATATAVASGGAGVATAISQLDGTVQLVVIATACVALLALLWIARERIRKWAEGDR